MAGINRLGKGPPKAGSLRPPDPNRRQDLDLMSAGAEQDADYMRMVHDIEDTQQNQSGWLFTRGAFDKGDLLYLRDEEEKRRFQEVELRDSERSQFLKARAKIEADQAAAVQRRVEAARRERASRPQKGLLGVVKVKAVNATDGTGPPGAQQPPAKKQKLDDSSAQAAGSQAAAGLREAPAASPPAAADEAGSSEEGGLAGLLGGYASDSDEDAVAVGSRETDSRQAENG